jgi:hypothetical protein
MKIVSFLPHQALKQCLRAMLFVIPLLLSACASNTASRTGVEGISFTDVDGTPLKTQPTTLTVGQGTYVNVILNNDPDLLGADWTAVCGSALPPGQPLPPGQVQDDSCGTFTPAHSLSGPVPTYITDAVKFHYVALYVAPAAPPKQGVVTLYASPTVDHSRAATVTLTITGQPISVGFAPAPPTSMQVASSASFRVALSNDVTNAGVRWTALCGSSDCGSFGPVVTASGVSTTYVAPASVPLGGTVQVTATSIANPLKSITANVSITP